jgi:alpha-tubulin suppressor-like RCC1 family protein
MLYQWLRSPPSVNEPNPDDYQPITRNGNRKDYVLSRYDIGRWIKVVIILGPSTDKDGNYNDDGKAWYLDGFIDDPDYGYAYAPPNGKLEPLAYGPVTEPNSNEVLGPNSVIRDTDNKYSMANGKNPTDWKLDDESLAHHYLTAMNTGSGVLDASYGERNRWITVRTKGEDGFKKVLVRSGVPMGDYTMVIASGKGVRRDNTLWSWGDNKNGMVGDGGGADAFVSRPKQIMTQFGDWASIAGGELHVLALRANGEIYAWGSSFNGLLGVDVSDFNPDGGGSDAGDQRPLRGPPRKLADSDWASISAGSQHSFAVKRNGDLYSWGSNAWGQLGNGNGGAGKGGYEKYPVKIGNKKWKQVMCVTTRSSAGIDENGDLYTWGANQFGQLGIGMPAKPVDDAYVTEPRKVEIDGEPNIKWVTVTGGNNTVYAISQAEGEDVEDGVGYLWSWGSNRYSQIGRDGADDLTGGLFNSNTHPIDTRPGKVENANGTLWRQVSVLPGTAHVLAIDEEGHLWAWGDNRYGQIGNGEESDAVEIPTLIVIGEYVIDGETHDFSNAKWLSVSTAYGVEGQGVTPGGVAMAVMEDDGESGAYNGSLWAWGDNSSGLLGLGSSGNVQTRPQLVPSPGLAGARR